MTVQYRASSAVRSAGFGTSGSVTTVCSAGDVLVAMVWSAAANSASPFASSSGWTLVEAHQLNTGRAEVWRKVATGTNEVATWTFANSTSWHASVSGYYDDGGVPITVRAADSVYTAGESASVSAPSITADLPGRLVCLFSNNGETSAAWTPPSGMTEVLDLAAVSSHLHAHAAVAAGSTGVRTATYTGSNTSSRTDRVGASLLVAAANQAPNAPTLVSPASGVALDRTVTQRLDWTFSDPDTGDSQSKYDLRYRIVGAGSWTETSGTTPNTFHDLAGGIAAGDYEWQVRTYDAQGLVGPYSASGFFAASTPPSGPTITAPTSGGTVAASSFPVQWSIPDQDAYQLRTVADNAGSPNTGTVYTDTGTVTSTTVRARTVAFATNNRYEHIQLRVQKSGLWSTWTSIRVLVSYTPPATATLGVVADDLTGSITVTISNPAPSGGAPSVAHNDLWRREGSAGDGIRIAAGLPAGATFTDRTPASGISYEYLAVTVGDNSTGSSSAWTG